MMRIFRDNKTTAKISALETAIARLTSEVSQLKEIVQSTHRTVGAIQRALADGNVAHTECATTQNERWKAHEREHERAETDFQELKAIVEENARLVRILSGNIERLYERERNRGGS